MESSFKNAMKEDLTGACGDSRNEIDSLENLIAVHILKLAKHIYCCHVYC